MVPGIPGELCEEVLCKISKRLVQQISQKDKLAHFSNNIIIRQEIVLDNKLKIENDRFKHIYQKMKNILCFVMLVDYDIKQKN